MAKKIHQDSEDYFSLAEFRQFMYEKIVPLEDLTDMNDEPLGKSFAYWRRHRLLPFIAKGKWIKITFSQLIWVRMLDTLRSLGYTIENTQRVCDYLFKDAYDNDLPERNIKDNRDLFKMKELAGTISDQESIVLQQIEEIANDKVLLYLLKYDINYLTNLITSCLSSGEEAGLLIFKDGEVGEHLGTHYFSHSGKIIDHTKPHIYLSITYFLKEFIDSEELQSLIMPQLLNDDEKSVLKELRNKNVNEIVIKRNGNNDLRIESSRNGVVTGEEMKEIRRILGLRNYEEIKLSTRDEKTLNFKRTKKKIKSG
jgi:hypothetical protein